MKSFNASPPLRRSRVPTSRAQKLAEATTTAYFRPYYTTDIVGTELGGAVKNVIALANGMAFGLGFGENAQASLITRGLAEMSRLGAALGANPMTFLGLAGIGDLIATCTSPLSRNRTFGENLGRGLTVDQTIAKTKQTCEGVKSCQSILTWPLQRCRHAHHRSGCPGRPSRDGTARNAAQLHVPRSQGRAGSRRSVIGRRLAEIWLFTPAESLCGLTVTSLLREMPEVVAYLDLMGLRNDRVAQ